MKKQLLFLLTIILSFNCHSQISFEKGYYIDNTNQRVDCLIKNIDWKNNPIKFEYKLSEDSEAKEMTIKSIKEFGINEVSKYVRATLKIDRSSEILDNLSNNRNPIFKEEELFLKVLVEGKANLYLFKDGDLERYFYSKENSAIEQLIFKSYKTSINKIGKNNRFKNQLWNNLKCPDFKKSKFEYLDYQRKDLVDFFVEYNECKDGKVINYEKKQKKDLFNLNIRPGFNSHSLSIQNNISNSRNTDFGNGFGFRFGIEAEFIMPFNKNKWSLIIEPNYQYFKSEREITDQTVIADYQSIEVPVGIRHFFFLNENSKIFINGSFIIGLSSNLDIDFSSGTDLESTTRNNLAFGIGYKYSDKYSLELRYQESSEFLRNYISWSSDYNAFSVIFGYSLF